MLPLVSRAMAVRVCAPFAVAAVFQVVAYGGVVSSAPRAAPSSLNWTAATAALSVAFAVTVTLPATVAPFAGAVIAVLGGVVSGGGAPSGGPWMLASQKEQP